jgi:tetrapyrrole methylase family protein / MazG family protein
MPFDIQTLQAILSKLEDIELDSIQIITAPHLATQHYPHIDPGQPTLLLGPADRTMLQKIVGVLQTVFPPDYQISHLSDYERQDLPLAGIVDVGTLEHNACFWFPALDTAADYAALQDVIARLRAPDGCPWDRELTWDKLRASLLEESHELLAALDAGEPTKVAEELGDLLLQIGMQAQIANEEGHFRLADVIEGIVSKLIRRHPHVFGAEEVSGTEEVLANWEEIKRIEREQNGEKRSPLAGVPVALPALAQAEAYLDRMSRLKTIDVPQTQWRDIAALPESADVSAEMVGEALFGLVAWAWHRGIDAESALRQINASYAATVDLNQTG